MPSKNDFEFGRIAVDSKFLSKEQLQDGILYQIELEKTGRKISLERVLYLCDFITESQILRAQNVQKRRIFYCVNCQTKINAWGYDVGVEIKCPKCSTIFKVPDGAFLDFEKASFVDIKKQIEIIRQQKSLSKSEDEKQFVCHETLEPTVKVVHSKTGEKKDVMQNKEEGVLQLKDESIKQEVEDKSEKPESKISSVRKISRLERYKKDREKE